MAEIRSPCYSGSMLTPRLCRAARAALGWSITELARRAGIGEATIARFERSDDPAISLRNLARIRRALEEGGVEILDERTMRIAAEPPPSKSPRRR